MNNNIQNSKIEVRERRKHVRYSFNNYINFKKTNSDQIINCFCGNVSEGGLMILSPIPLNFNDNIEVGPFYYEENKIESLKLNAIVKWNDRSPEYINGQVTYPTGVEFVKNKEVNEENLKKFVECRDLLIKAFLIQYTFTFQNGHESIFNIALDSKSLHLINFPINNLPDWAKRDHFKCPNCTLNDDDGTYCPYALSLVTVIEQLEKFPSFERIYLKVITEERVITQYTSIQVGISSLMSLLLAASGCPKADFLKPFARFHLPISSEFDHIHVDAMEETLYRHICMFLLSKYFNNGESFTQGIEYDDFDLKYKELHMVNVYMSKRLRSVSMHDAISNAIVILDMYILAIPRILKKSLNNLKYLFK